MARAENRARCLIIRWGERYYDRAAMQRLEQIRERIQDEDAVLREVGRVLVCDR
jgi:hypothetical protein